MSHRNTTPTQARKVRDLVAEMLGEDATWFEVFSGTHEELSPSAKVIVAEIGWVGDAPWPVWAARSTQVQDLANSLGLWVEAVSGCALGVYRQAV